MLVGNNYTTELNFEYPKLFKMAQDLKEIVNSPLPKEILPGISLSAEESRNYIKNFLMKTLPSTDSKSLSTDMKWNFLLDKHSLYKKKNIHKKKTFLTRSQKRELKLLTLPKEGWNYKSLEGLCEMWKEYMRQNLNLISKAPTYTDQDWTAFSNILAKSELIGSEVTVIKSKVPNQVGMTGTVVLETKMTFQIVTPQSKLKVIVKPSAVFQFNLDNMKFVVYGKYIATRPVERSVRKIKGTLIPEL